MAKKTKEMQTVFHFQPDGKGGALNLLMYIGIIGASLYFTIIYFYSEQTFYFYLFFFSLCYAVISAYNAVFGLYLLQLPKSIVEIEFENDRLTLTKKSGEQVVLRENLTIKAPSGGLEISGTTAEGKKESFVVRKENFKEGEFPRCQKLVEKKFKKMKEEE